MRAILASERAAEDNPVIRITVFLARPTDNQWQFAIQAAPRPGGNGMLTCLNEEVPPILSDHRSRRLSRGLPQLDFLARQEFDVLVGVVREPQAFHYGPRNASNTHIILFEERDAYLDLVRVNAPTGRYCTFEPPSASQ